MVTEVETLIERARALAQRERRAILGIAGKPGGGKSTLAQTVVAALGSAAVLVPMDGFHLAQAELVRLGRRDRMGAPDTFDALGYIALLRRLREAHRGRRLRAGVPARDRGADRGRHRGPARDAARRHRGQLPAGPGRAVGGRPPAPRRVLVRRPRRGHPAAVADRAPRRLRQDAAGRRGVGAPQRPGQRGRDRHDTRPGGRRLPAPDPGRRRTRGTGLRRALTGRRAAQLEPLSSTSARSLRS